MSQNGIDKTADELKQYLATQVNKMQRVIELASTPQRKASSMCYLENLLRDVLVCVDDMDNESLTNNPEFVKAFINRRATVLKKVVMKNIVAFNRVSVNTVGILHHHCIDVEGREFFSAIREDLDEAVWYCVVEKGSTELTWAYYSSDNFVTNKDFDLDLMDTETTTILPISINEIYELLAVLDLEAMISLFEF